jgi:hypothetical protein
MRRTNAPPRANVARSARPPVRGSATPRRGRSATVVVPGPAAALRLTSTGAGGAWPPRGPERPHKRP